MRTTKNVIDDDDDNNNDANADATHAKNAQSNNAARRVH